MIHFASPSFWTAYAILPKLVQKLADKNTTGMYASIKGIAGNAVQSVSLLELPSEDVVDL